MATTPFAPPIPPALFGANYGNETPYPPVLLGAQQLAANAAAFSSIFIQPVNSLWFYLNVVGASGSDTCAIRFNADSGANYWDRNLTVAAGGVVVVDTNTLSTTLIRLGVAGTLNQQIFGVIGNPSAVAAKSKVLRAMVTVATGAAGTAGSINIGCAGEWVNTSTPINRIDVVMVGANNYLAGSSLMVWGNL